MRTLVIGAGPSGMMAAIKASEKGQVKIIDKNEKAGRKLYITGKGRCNVTNAVDISEIFDSIVHNHEFLYSSLYTFTNEDLMDFFRSRGCKLKVERGNRVFPISDKASDIIKTLEREMEKCDVVFSSNTKVIDIILTPDKKRIDRVITDSGFEKADNYIFACGGASYPLTGSDGEMIRLLKKVGISIKAFTPTLIPFKTQVKPNLAGVSLKNIGFKVLEGKKVIFDGLGELLFTHDGISGPLVLSASSYIDWYKVQSNAYRAVIDLKPALDLDVLEDRILRDFSKNLNKDIRNGLSELLIQSLIPVILKRSNIDETKKINTITKEERKRLVQAIKNFDFIISDTRPIAEAIVSRGGIDVSEIDPSTMKSKKLDNVFFAGEMIDVDALTGGFNLQIAFSTGYLAGMLGE